MLITKILSLSDIIPSVHFSLVYLLSANTLRAFSPSVILQSTESYFTCPLISASAFIVVIIQHLAFMALPDKSLQ